MHHRSAEGIPKFCWPCQRRKREPSEFDVRCSMFDVRCSMFDVRSSAPSVSPRCGPVAAPRWGAPKKLQSFDHCDERSPGTADLRIRIGEDRLRRYADLAIRDPGRGVSWLRADSEIRGPRGRVRIFCAFCAFLRLFFSPNALLSFSPACPRCGVGVRSSQTSQGPRSGLCDENCYVERFSAAILCNLIKPTPLSTMCAVATAGKPWNS